MLTHGARHVVPEGFTGEVKGDGFSRTALKESKVPEGGQMPLR